jgi:predicted LPLAT superfamily acyltransferase
MASHAARNPVRTQTISLRAQPLTTMLFDTDMDMNTLATRLLRDILQQTTVQPPMEPVVVRPTEQQISTATTVETVVDEGDMCAICQDTIAAGTQVRTLNACEHSFHTGCIDAWFRTNVHCPVCRHDIRET